MVKSKQWAFYRDSTSGDGGQTAHRGRGGLSDSGVEGDAVEPMSGGACCHQMFELSPRAVSIGGSAVANETIDRQQLGEADL